jgi:hypothetical protein
MGYGNENGDIVVVPAPAHISTIPLERNTIDPLHVEDNGSIKAPRTKFRLAAIITALYVSNVHCLAIDPRSHALHS